jgi:hypothetical protein
LFSCFSFSVKISKKPNMGNSATTKPSKRVQIALGVTSAIIILAVIAIILSAVLIPVNNQIPLTPTVTLPLNPPTSVSLWTVSQ